MDVLKLGAILQVLLANPNVTLQTSGVFVVREQRLECVKGKVSLVETKKAIRVSCVP